MFELFGFVVPVVLQSSMEISQNSFFRPRTWALLGSVLLIIIAGYLIWHRSAPVRAVPVLMYHDIDPKPGDKWTVTPKQFEEHLSVLRAKGFVSVLPDDLVKWTKGEGALPEKPILITFDDGSEGVGKYGEALLSSYGFKAIAYLVVGAVSSDTVKREVIEGRPTVSWSEVLEMQKHGTISFGIHGWRHVALDDVPNLAEDLQKAKTTMQEHGLPEPNSFSYPFGSCGKKASKIVQAAGFTTTLSTDPRVALIGEAKSLLRIPRLWITGDTAFPIEQLSETSGDLAKVKNSVSWLKFLSRCVKLVVLVLVLFAVCSAKFSELVVRKAAELGKANWLVVLIIAAGTFVVTGAVLLNHYAFQTGAFDVRLHEEIIRNTFKGKFMYSDLMNRSFMGVHAAFIFPLTAFPYFLWPTATGLMVLQGLLVAAAAWFLWRLSREYDVSPLVSFALIVSFLFYKGMVSSVLTGYHQEVVAIFLLLGLFWAIRVERFYIAGVFGVLALLCREDVAIPMSILGALIFLGVGVRKPGRYWEGERAFGGLMFLVGSLWFAATVFWIIPQYAVQGKMDNLSRWAQYGSNTSEIAIGLITHPVMVLKSIWNSGALGLFAPLAFLPLLDLRTILPLALPIGLCATSSFSEQSQMNGAYPALYIAYIFAGMVHVLAYSRAKSILGNSKVQVCLALVLVFYSIRPIPLPDSFNGVAEAHRGIRELEKEFSSQKVLAQASILPHLYWPKEYRIIGETQGPLNQYDMILLSEKLNPWPMEAQNIRELNYKLSKSARWQKREIGVITVFSRAPGSK